MARRKMTNFEIYSKVKYYLNDISTKNHSDELILKSIRSKDINKLNPDSFNEQEIKYLKKIYKKFMESKKLDTELENIYYIPKEDLSLIETDILNLVGERDKTIESEEKRQIIIKMIKNYRKSIPEELKLKAHQNIINTSKYIKKEQYIKIRNKKLEAHKKFFIGGTFLSFLDLDEHNDNPLEILFEAMKLYHMQKYFDKNLLSDHEVDEFNISEIGRNFSNKKNSIILIPNNPF